MNKKIIGLFIGILFVIPLTVKAESYTFNDISFELDSDYTVTTKDNVDTSTYIPLEYNRDQVKVLFNDGTFSLLGINKDRSNIKMNISDTSDCGSIASNKSEMSKCVSNAVSNLKEKENVNSVTDKTFTSKNGINYYTLSYFKYGSALLDVTTSYNNKVYTFTLATSYSKDDLEKHAKEIMDSVSLSNFKKNEEKEAKETKEGKSNNNSALIIGAVGVAIAVVGGAVVYFIKKK